MLCYRNAAIGAVLMLKRRISYDTLSRHARKVETTPTTWIHLPVVIDRTTSSNHDPDRSIWWMAHPRGVRVCWYLKTTQYTSLDCLCILLMGLGTRLTWLDLLLLRHDRSARSSSLVTPPPRLVPRQLILGWDGKFVRGVGYRGKSQ